jgi:hypothetical protein
MQSKSFDMWMYSVAHNTDTRRQRSDEQRQRERACDMQEVEASLASIDVFRNALVSVISRERVRACIGEGGRDGGEANFTKGADDPVLVTRDKDERMETQAMFSKVIFHGVPRTPCCQSYPHAKSTPRALNGTECAENETGGRDKQGTGNAGAEARGGGGWERRGQQVQVCPR